MDENEPKLQSWNIESEHISNSPEMQKQQPIDWSAVGESMSKDVNERITIKWYFNFPLVFIILVISYFVINPIGPILAIILMSRVIIASAKSNPRPGKTVSIIGWVIITVLFVGLTIYI